MNGRINSEAVADASAILEKAARSGLQAEVIENPRFKTPELNPEQVDLITEIGHMGAGMADMIGELMTVEDTDKRWVSIGATHLQQGLMALERAVAKPIKF